MAVDATGTPTSPDSLAKLSSSDAPRITSSGGINAIVDTIQTALNTKIKITGAPSSNQVPVWNGSAWVPSLLGSSSVTNGSLSLSTLQATSNADLTLTTSTQDVANTSITLPTATTYLIIVQCTSPLNTTTGWGTAQIQLSVNGSPSGNNIIVPDPGTSTGSMYTVGKSYIVTTGGTNQIAKVQAAKNVAAGVIVLQSTTVSIIAIKLTLP